ncbi:hypothetical protein [Biformimicrobium ophioploci]|uniref:Tetratricopeptide repeat protein n=1 Tax=Biformimicrobium ophioploci TaxID=3036711 RepID=A0ABQ6LYT7_9GAMM|nr:hypothetical protein [Microbulbifer sp. NKW57]GMG87192.1 hypothetical protein MNKW57_15130 [Microbulbifer sp. NKW57]
MRISKQVCVAVMVVFSGLVSAAEAVQEKQQQMTPYQGEEVSGQWIYDASAAGIYQRSGSIDNGPLVITSDSASGDSLGYVMKRLDASHFRGKRVLATFRAKPTKVSHTVVAWISAADQKDDQREYLTWDNTWVTPWAGTSDWAEKRMVLQVPLEADYLFVGAGLAGTGKVEIGPIDLEIVADSVAVTDKGFISKLYKAGKYRAYLAELDKIDFGHRYDYRYAVYTLQRFYALSELGDDDAADEALTEIYDLVESADWQSVNNTAWGQELRAEVLFLADEMGPEDYLRTVSSIEFPAERDSKAAMKSAYSAIGFYHRMTGNYTAAKGAYAKAASREWGKDLSYDSADRRLKEMEQQLAAIEEQ